MYRVIISLDMKSIGDSIVPCTLMPDGFEDGIDPQQMADLIAYLQGANLH